MKNYIQIIIILLMCTRMFGQEKNRDSVNNFIHTQKSFSASISEDEKSHDYVCSFENRYYDKIRTLVDNDFENNYSVKKKDFSYNIELREGKLTIQYNFLNNSNNIKGENILGKIKKIERGVALIAK